MNRGSCCGQRLVITEPVYSSATMVASAPEFRQVNEVRGERMVSAPIPTRRFKTFFSARRSQV
jgi:hypothetical protein